MKLLVLFYSMYGHTYRLALAEAEGAKSVHGTKVDIMHVPELVPPEILEKSGAAEAQKAFAHIPIATIDDLADHDAIIFGTPTRYGNMCGQMREFLDSAGGVFKRNDLVGKVGSVFTSSGTQHGGQESTILSFQITLMHFGMVVVGLPYTFKGLSDMNEISGGTPYGASAITGSHHDRGPNENELAGARYQGRYVATIASRLSEPPIDFEKL